MTKCQGGWRHQYAAVALRKDVWKAELHPASELVQIAMAQCLQEVVRQVFAEYPLRDERKKAACLHNTRAKNHDTYSQTHTHMFEIFETRGPSKPHRLPLLHPARAR